MLTSVSPASSALQEVADLRSAVAALEAEKADLTTQLDHRIGELMELADQLEAEKTAAEQREADLQKVGLIMVVTVHL